MKYNRALILIIIIALAVLGLAAWGAFSKPEEISETDVIRGWKTAESGELVFKYPEDIGAQYISTVDWPPQVQIIDEEFSCTEAGERASRAGRTEMRIIGGKNYCVTEVTGAAAGSTYTQYAYAFPRENYTAIFTFSLRFPQCANYPEPQMSACQSERDSFNIDNIVDEIASTI